MRRRLPLHLIAGLFGGALASGTARASFLPPAMIDTAATYLAWFILFAVPTGGLVLFWLVHILPEKVAEKRHHPQKDAITAVCILSLFFGGMLWPIAWIWAYTKPVLHRMAYGTDRHEEEPSSSEVRAVQEDIARLRMELDVLGRSSGRAEQMSAISAQLAALERDIAGDAIPGEGRSGTPAAAAGAATAQGGAR